MSFRTQRTTPPNKAAVPLRDVKLFMRVDDDDENPLIKSLAMAATDYAERYMRRSLIDQVWTMYLDKFPICDYLYLSHGPITSINSITYRDQDGVTQTFDPTKYALDRGNQVDQRVYLLDGEVWPTDEAIEYDTVAISYNCGYGDEESIPDEIKTAIKMIANHWYENRETVVVGTTAAEVPMTAKALVDIHRTYTAS